MKHRSKQSVGFGGGSLLTSSHTSRTLLPIDYSEDAVRDIVMKNLRDFRTLVKFHAHNGLNIYRSDGDIVPIATHPFNTYDWKKDYHQIFESIGKWMENECFRLIVEPQETLRFGQVMEKDVLGDLECLRYYCMLLEVMQLSEYNKVLIDIGIYEDQKAGVERFIRNFFRMPSYIKNRLALVNGDYHDSIEQTLYAAKETQLPFIFRYKGKLEDFRESFSGHKRAIMKTWNEQDGHPIVQILEDECDTREEFYRLIKYDAINEISATVNDNKLSVIYESSFNDIAAVKIANILTEQRGVFLKEACIKEWQRYRHLIMAHDPDGFVMMQHYMEKPTSFKDFYTHIEQIMGHFKLMPNDLFAAEEMVNDFGERIRSSERLKALEYLKERDMTGFRTYCHGLAEAYDIEELSTSYYFHLN